MSGDLVYTLLSDYYAMESNHVLSQSEMKSYDSCKLSHRRAKTALGRFYLKVYFKPMVETAFECFRKCSGGIYLELGCGTGTQGITAVKSGFKKAVGIDADQEMITIANKRAAHYGVAGKFDYSVSDYWKYEVKEKVNAVYSMFAFELFGLPVNKAVKRLNDFCDRKAVIVFDMGGVKRLYNDGYYHDLKAELERYGFTVRLQIMLPFFVRQSVYMNIGNRKVYPFFRALRIVAERS